MIMLPELITTIATERVAVMKIPPDARRLSSSRVSASSCEAAA
jgi:hypothetical protein